MGLGNNYNALGRQAGRSSNLELLRIFCILCIIGDHFVGQSGVADNSSFFSALFYCTVVSLSRVACDVFIIISAWFMVDKEFHLRKIIHVWLTVAMYTVPITIFLYVNGVANADIFWAFLPVEASPLWFAGYYIILVCLSPVLNLFINRNSKSLVELFLGLFFITLVLFSTITDRPGFFGHDIWTLIFLYVSTGYIKRYVIGNRKESKDDGAVINSPFRKAVPGRYFLIFGILWLTLNLLRALVAVHGSWHPEFMAIVSSYLEHYRSRLSTLPCLIMAYTAFFGFFYLRMKNSKVVNKAAGAVLGIYCMHQVPFWYDYLWKEIFHSTEAIAKYTGGTRMLYTIACILTVWLAGTLIELVRNTLSERLIEKQPFCVNICSRFDTYLTGCLHGQENTGSQGHLFKTGAWKGTVLVFSAYFLILTVSSLGINHFQPGRHIVTNAPLAESKLQMDIHPELVRSSDGSKVTGTIDIVNRGGKMTAISSGKYPINLGISVISQSGKVKNQDYKHIPIKKYGNIYNGERISLHVNLDGLGPSLDEGDRLRLEIVQEGVQWFKGTETWWDGK